MRFFLLYIVFLLTAVSQQSFALDKKPCRKVLFIMDGLCTGGNEVAFIHLMNNWAVPNTKVEICLLKRGGVLEPLLRKDFPLISVKKARKRFYDVAACFKEFKGSTKMLSSLSRAKRKVHWVHTDLLGSSGDSFFRHKHKCKKIDAVFFVSERAKKSAIKIQPKLKKKIFRLYNVLDQDSIKRKATQEQVCFPRDGACNVVTVARLAREKAIDRAIRIHSRLEKENVFFRWYVVGGGPHQGKLEQLADACGLTGKFIFLGEKTNPYPYIAAADIFALPSLFEGCSVAVNEAKVLGRPVLMTDVGGAREQIVSGINGLIVDNNEEAIYQGLKLLLLDSNLRQTFLKNQRAFVYDNATIYKEIEYFFFSRHGVKYRRLH